MDAHRNVVVTVCGGGEHAPGDSLRALAVALPGPPGSYQRSDLVLGGDLYPRLLNSSPALPDLIEVREAGSQGSPPSWTRALRRLLGLIMGLPTVRFDWCETVPAMRTCQAYRDVVETTFLWSIWPVLLTLVHTVVLPVARTNGLLLEVLLISLLALLARSQWRPGHRVTGSGYVWLGLCLAVTLLLWRAPQWSGRAAEISIRVYGIAQLVAALVFLAMVLEVVGRIVRGRTSARCGLTGLCLAALPLALLSLLSACVWAGVLNAFLAVGSPPILEALKGWQQTFARLLGYHLASVEWAAASLTTLVAVLVLCSSLHTALTGRGIHGRRWLAALVGLIPLSLVLVSLIVLLTSLYLRAPLAQQAQRWVTTADVTTIYTWSALRLLPWLLLLATPARRLLGVLSDVGFYLVPAGETGLSSRPVSRERLSQVLRFLDRGCYDRIHILAQGQGSVVALDVLQNADLHHALSLTTCASPAGTLYGGLLDWPCAEAGTAEWRNLFRVCDPLGGPVGVPGVDVPLSGAGDPDAWSDAILVERVMQVMRAPLPAPRDGISTVR